MTRIEYECLRGRRPELGLPLMSLVWESDINWLLKASEQDVVTMVMAKKLSGNWTYKSLLMGSNLRYFAD